MLRLVQSVVQKTQSGLRSSGAITRHIQTTWLGETLPEQFKRNGPTAYPKTAVYLYAKSLLQAIYQTLQRGAG